MVSDNISRDTKLSNDMIEYKMMGCLTITFNSSHILYSFRELIHDHYEVMVPPSQRWVAIHKYYPPLGARTDGDNRV